MPSTLQQMIDACPEGGVVTVPPGEYREGNVHMKQREITICPAAGHLLTFGNGAWHCRPRPDYRPRCPHCGKEVENA